jgi:hypothetical protein
MDNSTCTAEHTHIHYHTIIEHSTHTPAMQTQHAHITAVLRHTENKHAIVCTRVVAYCRMLMPFAVTPTVTLQQSEPWFDLTYCCYSYGCCYKCCCYCYCCCGMVLRNVTRHCAQFQSMELCLLHTAMCSAQHTSCTQVSKLRDIMLY